MLGAGYIIQAESIQQREVLLREMEEANKQTAREVRSRREGKTTCAEELRAQVTIRIEFTVEPL